MPNSPHARTPNRHETADPLRTDPPAGRRAARADAGDPDAPPADADAATPPAAEEGSARRRRDAAKWMSALP